MRNYYRTLDTELGETLACVDENTTIMVVSDHGAKRMDGVSVLMSGFNNTVI